MKRMNFKRKLVSYIVIWSVIIGSLLSYSPEAHVFSATGVPEIKMVSPIGKSVFEVSKVDFIGRISDNITTPDKLILKVFESSGGSEQPIDITNEGKLTLTSKDQYAEFSYSKDFKEGDHKLSFFVTDEDGFSSKLEQSFTIQFYGTIKKKESIVNSVIDHLPGAQSSTEKTVSQTSVATEAVTLTTSEMNNRPYLAKMYLIPRGAENEYQPGSVPDSFLPTEDMTRVPLNYMILMDIRSVEPFNPTQQLITFFGDNKGTEKLVKTVDLSGGMKSYIYSFIPDNEKLDAAKTYFVYLNPNVLVPRFLRFTTVSNNYENYQFAADKGNDVREHDYIHGPFSIVTNTCAFCHSTHNGNNEFLESGKNGTDGDNLCMSCHDGTNGSPSLDTNYATNKHHIDSGASCSTCHDPHNPGTKENPNSLYKGTYGGITQLLAYKKASNSTGVAGDYSLCLSCHNGGKATNIEQYYKNDTLVSQSGHNIVATVDSGSSLNGQLPCAECHETHGSKNSKMIRENLGNVQSANSFSKTSGDWDSTAERQFCLSCHNDKTVLYGVAGKAIFDETGTAINTTNEQTKTGHNKQNIQACSECHSNNKSFIEAAHAPKKIVSP